MKPHIWEYTESAEEGYLHSITAPDSVRDGDQFVRREDYDQLLKLYEEVVECFKEVSGKYNWMRGGVSE